MGDYRPGTRVDDVKHPLPETDMALVQAARIDPRAFGALYDRYVDRVYRYLYRQTGRRETAEDLTSLTFLRALGGLKRVDPQQPFAPWLLRIAHNVLIDDRRAGAHTIHLTDAVVRVLVEQSDPQAESSLEQAEAFLAYTRGLPTDQRDALALRFIADLSTEQTATALGRSVAATKMLVWRAVAAVRRRHS